MEGRHLLRDLLSVPRAGHIPAGRPRARASPSIGGTLGGAVHANPSGHEGPTPDEQDTT